MCIVNGRFQASDDGFTSVSSKGMSVVDYVISPIKTFNTLSNFRVLDVQQTAMDRKIPIDSSVPDHRLVIVDMALNNHHQHCTTPTTKSQFKTMPTDYLLDPAITDKIESLAMKLENPPHPDSDLDESHLNNIYQEFCTAIDNELKFRPPGRKDSKCNTNANKGWWNSELGALAKEVRRALKLWEANREDTQLRSKYLHIQKEFNKAVYRDTKGNIDA